MSERQLPNWLDAYMEYTDNSEPPELFRQWVGISVLAAAMQRKCYLSWGMLTFYPNLYIILVGPPATRKGTAMYPGQAFLRKLEIPMAADATTLQALIRRLKEANATVVNARSMASFHSSLTVFSKEFTVFIGYKNNEMIAALCDWYDCDAKWIYDTKNQGRDEIIGVWVNLIGGTTPDLIRSSMPLETIGGGLTSRVIFVCEQKKAKTVIMPFLSPEQQKLEQQLFYDLERINLLNGAFQVTEKFITVWSNWYMGNDAMPPKHLASGPFAGYVQRRPNHVLKTSMVMSIARSSEMVLREEDILKAIDVLERTEKKMPEVFAGVGQNNLAAVIQRVLMYLRANKEVQFDQLMRMFYADADELELRNIVRTLETMKVVEVVYRADCPNTIRFVGPEEA